MFSKFEKMIFYDQKNVKALVNVARSPKFLRITPEPDVSSILAVSTADIPSRARGA